MRELSFLRSPISRCLPFGFDFRNTGEEYSDSLFTVIWLSKIFLGYLFADSFCLRGMGDGVFQKIMSVFNSVLCLVPTILPNSFSVDVSF